MGGGGAPRPGQARRRLGARRTKAMQLTEWKSPGHPGGSLWKWAGGPGRQDCWVPAWLCSRLPEGSRHVPTLLGLGFPTSQVS